MEIPPCPQAVYRPALIVLIIRKFLSPSRQNLPRCSLSPLFLVFSAADTKNRRFLPSAAALSVSGGLCCSFLSLLLPRSSRALPAGTGQQQLSTPMSCTSILLEAVNPGLSISHPPARFLSSIPSLPIASPPPPRSRLCPSLGCSSHLHVQYLMAKLPDRSLPPVSSRWCNDCFVSGCQPCRRQFADNPGEGIWSFSTPSPLF